MLRLIVAVALTTALAGCQTIPPSGLTPAEVGAMRLASVDVKFAPGASVFWGNTESEFAASKGIARPATSRTPGDDGALAAETDEQAKLTALLATEAGKRDYRAFLAAKLQSALNNAVHEKLDGEMAGTRPVRLEVTVLTLTIQNTLLRLLVATNHILKADLALVDAASGRTLATYPQVTVLVQQSGGVAGMMIEGALNLRPEYRLGELLAYQAHEWLLPR